MDHQELREEVARISRRMSASGLVVGTSGNVSIRTPDDTVLVTPSGLDYSELEPEDLALVDPDGRFLDGPFAPSSETPMHTGIYRARPRVGGIVHTHARFATTLACLHLEIPPLHYMLVTLSDERRVPLAPYATYGTEELARNVSETLGEVHHACLLQNHGTITVGDTAAEAYSRTEVLEEMAELYYRARLAGEPTILSPEQLAEVAAKISDYGQSRPASGAASG